jgi:2-aminoadipate transaminase
MNMSTRLAGRMASMRTSEIREILKLTQKPGMISFAGGLPAAELFPVEQMVRVTEEVLLRDGHRALQYSTTEGDPPLREAIAERMNRTLGTSVRADEILITSGSQQGLDLSGKLFLDEGDVVLCESPTYLGAINALRAYRPRFVEVPTDDGGMVIDELERCLAENDRIKVAYVVPEFQNPTGRTWSLERRRAFLEIMARRGIPILEDSPYGELRFEGDGVPSLKTLDTHNLVVFLGTFSKTFCPGLRVGWLAASPELREKYIMVKQGVDLHTSTLCQRQIAVYLELFSLDADIERIRDTYRGRRDAMLRAMDESFPPGIHYNRPQGGMFLWVELPDGIDAREILKSSLEDGVAFVPGAPFFPNGGHENTLRLNFSAMPEERIEDGVRRLARILTEAVDAVGARAAEAPLTAIAGERLGR